MEEKIQTVKISGWRKRKRRRANILPPTNVIVAPKSGTQICVEWTASASPSLYVTGYNIIRDMQVVATVPLAPDPEEPYIDAQLINATSYTYKIEAFNIYGGSALSGEVSTSTLDTVSPDPPESLSGEGLNETEIHLTWTEPSDNVGVTGYKIYRTPSFPSNPLTTSLTSFTDSNLQAFTDYTYDVVAFDAAGNESTPANITVKTLDLTPPNPPQNVQAIADSETQITISMDPSDSPDVVEYKVYSGFDLLASITPPLTYIHTGLTPYTDYTYRVTAIDSSGNISPYSESVNAKTLDTTAPSDPSSLAIIVERGDLLNLAWVGSTDSGSGVAGYEIVKNNNVTTTTIATSLADITIPYTFYEYKIRSIDVVGNQSGFSNAVTLTTPGNIFQYTSDLYGFCSTASSNIVRCTISPDSTTGPSGGFPMIMDQLDDNPVVNCNTGIGRIAYTVPGEYWEFKIKARSSDPGQGFRIDAWYNPTTPEPLTSHLITTSWDEYIDQIEMPSGASELRMRILGNAFARTGSTTVGQIYFDDLKIRKIPYDTGNIFPNTGDLFTWFSGAVPQASVAGLTGYESPFHHTPLSLTTVSTDDQPRTFSPTISTVVEGDTYELSMWAKSDNGSEFRVGIVEKPGSGSGWNGFTPTPWIVLTSEWTKFTVQSTMATGTVYIAAIIYGDRTTIGNEVISDGMQLIKL